MFGGKARRAGPTWLGCALLVACATAPALAQVPAVAPEQPVDAQRAGELGARKHFDRALELYRAGRYASARDELKAAAELDPNGKDLFFNLALVEEKLGQLEQAIAALERFRALENDPLERARALSTIERLRGAQRATMGEARPAPCPQPAAAPVGSSAVLIGSASLAVSALAVGAIFGVKALNDDVGDQRTSSSLSVAQLRARAARAEREALVADVAFAVAAASAGTFVCVWLLSPGQPAERGALLSMRGRF